MRSRMTMVRRLIGAATVLPVVVGLATVGPAVADDALGASDTETAVGDPTGVSDQVAPSGELAEPQVETVTPGAQPAAEQAEASPVTMSLQRIDGLGDEVHVGETIRYRWIYTNNSDSAVTIVPTASTLKDVVPGDSKNCRWRGLQPHTMQYCEFAYHVMTEEDVTVPFIPAITYKLTSDREGNVVIGSFENMVISDAPVSAKPKAPEPTLDLQTMPDGTLVPLATTVNSNDVCYRIPALTMANNGDVLAAWDYRPGSCGDSPNPNSIALRVWKKGTSSFGEQRIIAAGQNSWFDKKGYSDPSFVVDRTTGHIFMFSVLSYDVGLNGSHAGTDPTDRGVIHANVMVSKDHGETWEDRGIITDQVTAGDDWISRFATSGEGIQIREGKYKDRLVQQFAIETSTKPRFQAVSVFSDDHGEHWQVGTPVGTNMDENKVVELPGGTLMLNSRISTGPVMGRKVAYSTDGGTTWTDPVDDTNLVDPHNNASIIRAFPEAKEWDSRSHILLFSNANDASQRRNGTVRVSVNDGKDWSAGKVFSGDRWANMQYSTMTSLGDGQYGILFEAGGPTLTFSRFSSDWLGNFVHFVCSEGVTCPESQFLAGGEVSTQPEEPQREGFTFAGWAVSGTGAEFTFGEPVVGTVVLEAQWKPVIAEVEPIEPTAPNGFVIGGKEVTFGRPTDVPLLGDWDGDGVATPGVRRGNVFYLKNTLESGDADVRFTFGRPDDEAFFGDWDGDGLVTPGIRRGNTFYLKNSFAGGAADITFSFGRVDDKVLVGDWDGNRTDTIAVVRGNRVMSKNAHAGGIADQSFKIGAEGDTFLAGRWTEGQGFDSVSYVRDGVLYVNNAQYAEGADLPTVKVGKGKYLVGPLVKDGVDVVVLHG